MVNYDALPLFPLHLVLYPEMPLPLHIFEPRYREMITRCREDNMPFGVVLIQQGEATGEDAVPSVIGTTAQITQYEELPDGRMNIEVVGETRFRIREVDGSQPFLSAHVEPFWEQTPDPLQVKPHFDTAGGLFKAYLQSLFALQGRALSALQLPREPEYLSFAIASVLQIDLDQKQSLLEMTSTEKRLQREIELLTAEIEAHASLQAIHVEKDSGGGSVIVPADTQALGKLSSRN